MGVRFQTARDWLDAIGAVPLERIVFDPWPGTATEAGTRLVWYVDPPTRTIAVYTGPGEPATLTAADRLTGGEVLAGFDVAVTDVFDMQSA